VVAVKRVLSDREPISGNLRADLAGALHEVSNTLTVVLGWLDAAKSHVQSGAAHEAIDVALTHARLGHTIARRAIGAEAEDASITRSALSVARDALLGVAQEAGRANVRVEIEDTAANDLLVSFAPIAQQILINLLLNAVHFSRPRSTIVLAIDSSEQSMRYRVIDTGPGIAHERIDTLFASPKSTRRGGAGIGLRHASTLAQSHGGCLTLARTDSTGSEFCLDWPIGDAPSRAHRTVPPRALDGLRVLLLEDDPAVQALLDLGLSTRGATVASVGTGKEFVALTERGVFDVALLDLSPLGIDPKATLALVERARPNLPIIIISGSVAPNVDAPNIVGWVRKPFEVAEVVEALARIVRT
jgi:CheY-like chemotaxis protein